MILNIQSFEWTEQNERNEQIERRGQQVKLKKKEKENCVSIGASMCVCALCLYCEKHKHSSYDIIIKLEYGDKMPRDVTVQFGMYLSIEWFVVMNDGIKYILKGENYRCSVDVQ